MTEAPQTPGGSTWAVATTLAGPPEQSLAFVAHHLILGAAEMIVFCDDPADPVVERLHAQPRVRVILCDDAYWGGRKARPNVALRRQKQNASRAYKAASADWIIYLGPEDFISADIPLSLLLARTRGPVLRLQPFERLEAPSLSFGRNPAEMFRGALPRTTQGRAVSLTAYGPYFTSLNAGMFDDPEGRYFLRNGLAGTLLTTHAPFVDGQPDRGETAEDGRIYRVAVESYSAWRAGVEGVLKYARKGRPNATLCRLHDEQGEEGLRDFYARVCTYNTAMRSLYRVGALRRDNLWLEEKREDIFGDPPGFWNFGIDAETGQIEMDGLLGDIAMRLVPDNNLTESRIARAIPPETEERQIITDLVRSKRVLFYDVGANAGLYALTVARNALPESAIVAFEPNPEMLRRLHRNIEMNELWNISVRPLALGASPGRAALAGISGKNLGEVRLVSVRDDAPQVTVATLPDEMLDPKGYEFSILKIDVEGHEAAVLMPLLAATSKAGHLPDYIMLEHASKHRWGVDLLAELARVGYAEHWSSHTNMILHRGVAS